MSYEVTANKARQEPYIWKTLRTNMATANIVTEIRRGDYSHLSPSEFEARSYSDGINDKGKKRYGIEVRYIPPSANLDTIEQKIEKMLRKSFESMLPQLIQNIKELKAGEDS